jgi:hypothetical protein
LKTQQSGKYLAYAVVICELWRSALALWLSTVTSCVLVVNEFNIQSKTQSSDIPYTCTILDVTPWSPVEVYDVSEKYSVVPFSGLYNLIHTLIIVISATIHYLEALTRIYYNITFTFRLFLAGYLLGLLFNPEDGGCTFIRNFGKLSDYTASHTRR